MQLLPASLSSGEIHLLVEVRMHNPTLVAVLWEVGVLIPLAEVATYYPFFISHH